MAIRIRDLNGHVDDLPIDRLVRDGQDLAVDLSGRRSDIREIEMTDRSRPGDAGRAVVKVYGEGAGRR